jgi:hypothetical protein
MREKRIKSSAPSGWSTLVARACCHHVVKCLAERLLDRAQALVLLENDVRRGDAVTWFKESSLLEALGDTSSMRMVNSGPSMSRVVRGFLGIDGH